MFGIQPGIHNRNAGSTADSGPELLGYILTPRSFESTREADMRLKERSFGAGYRMSTMEIDVGLGSNPFRIGLWRMFRKLVCNKCEPKRMPFSMINFEDFMHQALAACPCGGGNGYAGVVMSKLDQLSSDRLRTSAIVLALAKMDKHVIADDGICWSCCHPATKKAL